MDFPFFQNNYGMPLIFYFEKGLEAIFMKNFSSLDF